MYLALKSVPLQSIVLTTDWNLHPWTLTHLPEQLAASFGSVGILNPPIVIPAQTHENRFHPVTGYRRISYAKNLPGDAINCLVLEATTAPLMILQIVLEDQLYSGLPLTIAEKARFLKIASSHCSQDEIETRFVDKLQIMRKRAYHEMLTALLDQDESLIIAAHRGDIQDQILGEMLQLQDNREKEFFVKVFQSLKLGGSKQKRLFHLVRDNAYKNRITISDFVRQPVITGILNHPELNNPQKFAHLADVLEQSLKPSFKKAEEDFNLSVKKLSLPKTHSLAHCQAFEKDEVTLSITFATLKECEDYLKNRQSA
ncbi:ParB/RepB/Spo0J family partition protein [Desulforhopalus singaporensis]|uniref:Chromosome partitioning protein, ParB family n=1 Tax=Desulforhopalus singaporensis TaxID=91360 RepID=A0A1H0MN44_9BACT|nr:ParB/RepB/Spo0J family partition protein [Desulforhopalus singaporensis]SDO81791.1 chromosome partitioning protein, ParB family [Desulforhopalus singaporensis]